MFVKCEICSIIIARDNAIVSQKADGLKNTLGKNIYSSHLAYFLSLHVNRLAARSTLRIKYQRKKLHKINI